MHCVITFLLMSILVVITGYGVNYCGTKMCGYSDEHTLCKYIPGPSPTCTGYIEADLTEDEKARILDRLNRRRNEAASGKLRGLSSAGNMLKLRWVAELAREAQLWADQCRPPAIPEEQDECRDLYSVTVGQCVASVVGEAPGLLVESMVDIWYMQAMHYKGNVTLYEPVTTNKRFYGDFGQMMWARVYMVGCGRSRFMVPIRGRLRSIERLVCNFAPRGPLPYRALWSLGTPATACPIRSQPDTNFPSMCDYQRKLDASHYIDNSMTMEEHILLNAVFEMERNQSHYLFGSLDEIYLTSLAIITMKDSAFATSRYNSMQKRDVVETVNKSNGNNYTSGNSNTVTLSEIGRLFNTTNQSVKTAKKKLKLIGRPKAYNVDDLSETGGDRSIEENDDTSDTTEAILKGKKHFYDEYNIVSDEIEDNVTIPPEHNVMANALNEVDIPEINHNAKTTIENVIMTASVDTIPNVLNNEAIVVESTEINSNIVAAGFNETLTVKGRKAEDYFTDPETVLQLQAALDRMEHSGEESNSGKSGKVRRDLREVPTEANTVSKEFIPPSNIPKSLFANEEKNKSDRTPMLNMMLKYMPYLKPYEKELLGSTDSARCVCSSGFLLLLTLAFCIL